MQKKSHTFWDNIDRSKCSPVTPEVLGIHSAVPEWWSGHEESRTPHSLLHKSPNFQAGQHSCIWSSKVPRNTSTGYQNAGKISRRLLINTWMLQGEEQLKLSVPAHRTKFQQLQLKFQAMLGEIPSEDDQSPRKKKPRELRNTFSGNSGVQQGLLEANNNFLQFPPSWAGWLPARGWVGVRQCSNQHMKVFMDLQLWEKQLLNPKRNFCAEVLGLVGCPGWAPSTPSMEVWWEPRN